MTGELRSITSGIAILWRKDEDEWLDSSLWRCYLA